MGLYHRMEKDDPNKCYEWLYQRCQKLLERQRLAQCRNELQQRSSGRRAALPANRGLCGDWVKSRVCKTP